MGSYRHIRSALIGCMIAGAVSACGAKNKTATRTPSRISAADLAASAFSISKPSGGPTYISSGNEIRIEGKCLSGATVEIQGAISNTMRCHQGAFAFDVSKDNDATYDFTLIQTDGNNNQATKSFQWTRNSSVPTTPTITSPDTNPLYSNLSMIPLKGSCTPKNTVRIAGLPAPVLTCSDKGVFATFLTTSVDGKYDLKITQRSLTGVDSGEGLFTWVRDTVAPAAPKITSPNPNKGSNHKMTLTGECEVGSTVALMGDIPTSPVDCPSGTFQIPLTATEDTTYKFTLFQVDAAKNQSPTVAFTWIKDKVPPSPPAILSPTPNPFTTNQKTIYIQASCKAEHQISYVSGAVSGKVLCSSGTVTIPLSANTDGHFSAQLLQIDPTGNQSTPTTFSWTLDTKAPPAPEITSPEVKSHTSSDSKLEVSGSCESGTKVYLEGALESLIGDCSSSVFKFKLAADDDDTYLYHLRQIDKAGNASMTSIWTWIKNSEIPPAPTIISPPSAIFHSNQNILEISGTCVTDAVVRVASGGSEEGSAPCTKGLFTLNVERKEDASFDFEIIQTSKSGVESAARALTWVRDTVAPDAPRVASPAGLKGITNGDQFVISGTCEKQGTVELVGLEEQSVTCSVGNYSFLIGSKEDGTFSYKVYQTDLAGNTSEAVPVEWARDTLPPGTIKFESPTIQPYLTGSPAFKLIGVCELGTKVRLHSNSSNLDTDTTCSDSGRFEFPISRTEDGKDSYTVSQLDEAGNFSDGVVFDWILDRSLPGTPKFISPGPNPFYTNWNEVELQLDCDVMNPGPSVVTLSGDLESSDMITPAGVFSQECQEGKVAFLIKKPLDGTYRIYAHQTNTATKTESAKDTFILVLDTVAPSQMRLISPASADYTSPRALSVLALCETGAKVTIAGAVDTGGVCKDGTFSLYLNELADGKHTFYLFQEDAAGNGSPKTTLTWVRSSKAPAPPVILTPSTVTPLGNRSPLIVSGNCTPGYQVVMEGEQQDKVQCSEKGQFTFSLNSDSDGVRNYKFKQFWMDLYSDETPLQWTYDTEAPVVEFKSVPASIMSEPTASFDFYSQEEGVKFYCKIDLDEAVPCSSVYSVNVEPGLHVFSIYGLDPAGNTGTSVGTKWTYQSSSTVGLYRFAHDNLLADSSGNRISLKADGEDLESARGIFETEGASLEGKTKLHFPMASAELDFTSADFTVEGFFKADSDKFDEKTSMIILSKGDKREEPSFELRIARREDSPFFELAVTGIDGKRIIEKSENLGSIPMNQLVYFALVRDGTTMNVLYGEKPGGGLRTLIQIDLGSKDAKLIPSNNPLMIGGGLEDDENHFNFHGVLDEFRISNRALNPVLTPTGEFKN